MVCDKKKYFLLGINTFIGTSLTPIITSQSETLPETSNPNYIYSWSGNTRISDDSTLKYGIWKFSLGFF